MAKSFYFSIQSWMLEEMDLSLTDIAVFAYINGLTNSEELGKQGWHGSIRRLAKVLHVSPSTMNDIINRLEERGVIRIYNSFITSTLHRELPPNEEPKEPTVRNPDTFSRPFSDHYGRHRWMLVAFVVYGITLALPKRNEIATRAKRIIPILIYTYSIYPVILKKQVR